MKSALLILFSLMLFSVSFANPPAVLALQAATIAQGDLESRGLGGQVFIEQINFKKETLMGGPAHWEVLWSDQFDAQTEGRKEFGLRIFMDGNYKRAVK